MTLLTPERLAEIERDLMNSEVYCAEWADNMSVLSSVNARELLAHIRAQAETIRLHEERDAPTPEEAGGI